MMMTHLAAYEKQFNPLILQHEEEVIGDAALDYTWSQVVSAFFARKDILDPLEMLSAMEMAQYRLLNQKLVAAQEKFQCQQQERLQSADAETKRSRSDRLQQPAPASFVTQSVLGAISEGRERERRKQADKVKAAALAAAEILNSRHRVNPDTMIPDQLAVDITRLAVGSSIIRCLLYLFRVITPLTDTQSAVLARKKDEVGSFLLWYEQKVNLNAAEARDVRSAMAGTVLRLGIHSAKMRSDPDYPVMIPSDALAAQLFAGTPIQEFLSAIDGFEFKGSTVKKELESVSGYTGAVEAFHMAYFCHYIFSASNTRIDLPLFALVRWDQWINDAIFNRIKTNTLSNTPIMCAMGERTWIITYNQCNYLVDGVFSCIALWLLLVHANNRGVIRDMPGDRIESWNLPPVPPSSFKALESELEKRSEELRKRELHASRLKEIEAKEREALVNRFSSSEVPVSADEPSAMLGLASSSSAAISLVELKDHRPGSSGAVGPIAQMPRQVNSQPMATTQPSSSSAGQGAVVVPFGNARVHASSGTEARFIASDEVARNTHSIITDVSGWRRLSAE
jgi:hypothetical protein